MTWQYSPRVAVVRGVRTPFAKSGTHYAHLSALDLGKIKDRFDTGPSPGTLWSVSAFLGADTFLGPGYVGVGFAGAGNWTLYMLLGAP